MKPKKTKSPEQPMFGYKVQINTVQEHYEHDGEQYGSWSASSSHTLDRKAEKVVDHPDIVSNVDIQSGTNALVVWVIWSSGDSFGRHDGGYSECVGIFTKMDAAKELAEHIRTKDWDKDPELNFKTSDGQEFRIGYAGWSGYFESIDSVEIDVVTVF